MSKFKDELDEKYRSIYLCNFSNSTLITKKEKRLIKILELTVFIFLIGFMFVSLLSQIPGINTGILGLLFVLIFVYSISAVFYLGHFVMKKCVNLLGQEYFDYLEENLIENELFIKFLPTSFKEWKENLKQSKHFKNGYGIIKKHYPLMFTKGVIYYFRYKIFIFFDNIPNEDEWINNLSKKNINLVFCIKTINTDDMDECKKLLSPGYEEKVINSVRVRFANIYYNSKTNEICHRPRALLYKIDDNFMKQFTYAKKPSVICDYSQLLSNYIITEILNIDLYEI